MKIPLGIIPFLTFSGKAEEAVNFYISVFPDSKIESIEYYREGERGITGKVKTAKFMLMGKLFMAFDIDEIECPSPTWATSFYINCADEAMFDSIFAKLSPCGIVLMGPEPVWDIRKASWVTDKFGVTWQVIWE